MMSALHLLWIVPLSGSLGALAAGILAFCAQKDEENGAKEEDF